MAGITFDRAIILAPHDEPTAALLFHELVHVVQYRLLGVEQFAQRYVDGWLAGRDRFRSDPAQRYVSIPLERNAYDLQKRYEGAPAAVFSVEEAVMRFLAL